MIYAGCLSAVGEWASGIAVQASANAIRASANGG